MVAQVEVEQEEQEVVMQELQEPQILEAVEVDEVLQRVILIQLTYQEQQVDQELLLLDTNFNNNDVFTNK